MAVDPPNLSNRTRKPRLASLCGTYLKPEMQSIYRQVSHVQCFENIVLAEQIQNLDQFPHEQVIQMQRLCTPRMKGNFILRYWYKHVTKQWPPPREINKPPPGPHFSYDLPQALAERKIDLVHVYYGHKAVKYLDMLRYWGGPFVVSFHGVDVSKFCDQPEYLAKMREVFAAARLVLARSKSLLEEVRALGCPAEKLRLNHTPIPLDKFVPIVREAPQNGEWRLVQASRLIPKKGLFTTLEALTKVVPLFPKLKFIVCGNGPVRDDFIAARDALDLQDHVEVLGWRNQAQLVEEYHRSHVFLHPSELTDTSDQEGIPNSMLEAMATGLPVVATLHGGIPEAVTNEFDGLLVAEKNPDELAAAIIRLLSSPDMLETFSKNAAKSVRENFGLESQVANLEACYKEALGK